MSKKEESNVVSDKCRCCIDNRRKRGEGPVEQRETRQLSLLVDGPRVRLVALPIFPYLNETLIVIISAVLETADDRRQTQTDILPI